MRLGRIFCKIFFVLSLPHDNTGPIPITKIAGIKMGTIVELKYGSPTEILLFVKISTNKGYVVPKKIEAQTITIIILLVSIAPSLLKNEKYCSLKNFFDFTVKSNNAYPPNININARM